MIVKYKVSDFAKDLNLSAKKVLDELAAMGSTGKKNNPCIQGRCLIKNVYMHKSVDMMRKGTVER